MLPDNIISFKIVVVICWLLPFPLAAPLRLSPGHELEDHGNFQTTADNNNFPYVSRVLLSSLGDSSPPHCRSPEQGSPQTCLTDRAQSPELVVSSQEPCLPWQLCWEGHASLRGIFRTRGPSQSSARLPTLLSKRGKASIPFLNWWKRGQYLAWEGSLTPF